VGRYVVKSKCPSYKWVAAAHPYLLTLIAVLSIVALAILQVLFIQLMPQLAIPVFHVTDAIMAGLIVFLSYLSLSRFTKWKRELAEYMKQFDALTEYDSTLYDPSSVISHVVWSVLCLTGFGIFILQYGILLLDMDLYPLLVMYLGIIPAAPEIFVSVFGSTGKNHCFNQIDGDDSGFRDFTPSEVDTAKRLKEFLIRETKYLGIENSFLDNGDYGEFNPELTYRKISFPHCRMFHTYTDESELNFQIWDMGAEPARRLIISHVRRLATPYFSEISLQRRVSALGNLLFLVFFFPVIALLTIPFGSWFIHPLLLIAGILFTWGTSRDYLLHKEAQYSYRDRLKESEYMTDYDLDYYYNEQFRVITRIDIGLFITFLLLSILAETIIFLTTGSTTSSQLCIRIICH